MLIFQKKGFSAEDLVALMGAHSCGANSLYIPFDSTPGVMDSPTFYTEVLVGNAPDIIYADKSLALSNLTTNEWQQYARSQRAWDFAYAKA